MAVNPFNKVRRCDVCTARAEADPRSLEDVFAWLAPPVELLEAIPRWQEAKEKRGESLPGPVLNYYRRWRRISSGEPVPEVDPFDFRDSDGDRLLKYLDMSLSELKELSQ